LSEAKELDSLRNLRDRLSYYLIVVPDGQNGRCENFVDLDQLQTRLASLQRLKCQCFVFYGDRWNLTKGPYKFLVSPEGDKLPLFASEEELEIDSEGLMHTVENLGAIPDDERIRLQEESRVVSSQNEDESNHRE
jgi:hypothetical protein